MRVIHSEEIPVSGFGSVHVLTVDLDGLSTTHLGIYNLAGKKRAATILSSAETAALIRALNEGMR